VRAGYEETIAVAGQLGQLRFFAVDLRGRTISDGHASRSTLIAVMKRDRPGRRFKIELGRGWAASYCSEIHEARAEPGPREVVTPSPSGREEVAPG
jgi:hypothetical protein